MQTDFEAEKPPSGRDAHSVTGQRLRRIWLAKLRLAEAVDELDVLGIDVQQIDLNAVLSFARSFLR